jgi:hypothetical protein
MLKQNTKIQKSNSAKIAVYNFGIPAYKSVTGKVTCPMAGVCKSGCYAQMYTYTFPKVKNAYEMRLSATMSANFVYQMNAEIQYLRAKHIDKQLYVRIHDSGDFYSTAYLNKWLDIINDNPHVKFYAYTKMISVLKSIKHPKNFEVIYSFGGKQDHLIDTDNDRHVKVYENDNDIPETYIKANDNDLFAITKNKRVALVYHGNKRFDNTEWSK